MGRTTRGGPCGPQASVHYLPCGGNTANGREKSAVGAFGRRRNTEHKTQNTESSLVGRRFAPPSSITSVFFVLRVLAPSCFLCSVFSVLCSVVAGVTPFSEAAMALNAASAAEIIWRGRRRRKGCPGPAGTAFRWRQRGGSMSVRIPFGSGTGRVRDIRRDWLRRAPRHPVR